MDIWTLTRLVMKRIEGGFTRGRDSLAVVGVLHLLGVSSGGTEVYTVFEGDLGNVGIKIT